MTDAQLQRLHDRVTRGEHLTAEEQAALDAWYTQQDQAESQLLGEHTRSATLADLHSQVAATAAQLEVVTRHIREALAENDTLRREIALLQQQLTDRAA